jgi:hypothetical protein
LFRTFHHACSQGNHGAAALSYEKAAQAFQSQGKQVNWAALMAAPSSNSHGMVQACQILLQTA